MALGVLFQRGRLKRNKYQNLKLHFKNDVMPILIPMKEKIKYFIIMIIKREKH